jgi:hypothetical protein
MVEYKEAGCARANGIVLPPRPPLTVQGARLPSPPSYGGDDRIRTDDPLVANEVLSQLSYIPSLCRQFYSDAGIRPFSIKTCVSSRAFLIMASALASDCSLVIFTLATPCSMAFWPTAIASRG